MRKILLFSLVLFSSANIFAQEKFEFTSIIDLDATEIKSQDNTGTCWSYSTTSFIESELIRLGKGKHNISEMFNVRFVYKEKALNYVGRQGKANFSQGSLSHDVMNSIRENGMVPDEVYTGLPNGEEKHNHDELETILKSIVDGLIKTRKLSENWLNAFMSVVDTYLGEEPEEFKYKGKKYTPQSFSKDMGINPDDYVNISSFSHEPFYKQFILNVPDNFSNGSFYNLPLDEYMQVIDAALENGFTMAWDADVSEKGFSSKEGVAVIPAKDRKDMSDKETRQVCKEIIPELEVTQENRQKAFDSHETTDDHLMHITGKLKDQKGNIYYKVKNSWGTKRGIDGFIYASAAFVKMKSISVMVHKDALPAAIKTKLNIK